MAATSLLARLGLRVATLGSAASLAIAAPIAEGDVSQAAHTHAARTGWFFPTATSIGLVLNGVEQHRLYADGGVQIGGPFTASGGAGTLTLAAGAPTLLTGADFSGAPNIRAFSNANTIGGVQLQNQSGGTAADTRLAILENGANTVGYLALAVPSTGNSAATILGRARATSVFIVYFPSSTGSARDLVIGTLSNKDVSIGTNALERVRVWADGGIQLGGTFTTSLGAGTLRSTALVQFEAATNHAITRVAVNTTLGVTHYTVEVDATSGAIDITLPDSTATSVNGRVYNIVKVDASVNPVNILRTGADTINGATSVALTIQYQSRTVQARAASTNWSII